MNEALMKMLARTRNEAEFKLASAPGDGNASLTEDQLQHSEFQVAYQWAEHRPVPQSGQKP